MWGEIGDIFLQQLEVILTDPLHGFASPNIQLELTVKGHPYSNWQRIHSIVYGTLQFFALFDSVDYVALF